MPESKVFVDTNVLIYAHDNTAGRKHHVARERVLGLWENGQGLLSTQVLQEFFLGVTRKIPNPVSLPVGRKIIEDLLSWELVINDGPAVLAAIDIQSRYRLSFWDSLIVQAALRGTAAVLLSEDLAHGQVIQGVTIQNPFVE